MWLHSLANYRYLLIVKLHRLVYLIQFIMYTYVAIGNRMDIRNFSSCRVILLLCFLTFSGKKVCVHVINISNKRS